MDTLAILFGWPSLAAALLLAAAGTWLRKPAAVWVGLVLTLPLAFYVSGSPAYPFLGVIPVLALAFSAVMCRAERRWPSYTGIGIYAAFVAALAYVVVGQP